MALSLVPVTGFICVFSCHKSHTSVEMWSGRGKLEESQTPTHTHTCWQKPCTLASVSSSLCLCSIRNIKSSTSDLKVQTRVRKISKAGSKSSFAAICPASVTRVEACCCFSWKEVITHPHGTFLSRPPSWWALSTVYR